ncbi:MAG TPA: hypothetical protein VF832_10375, partial [Longimicrobiales bacterium]
MPRGALGRGADEAVEDRQEAAQQGVTALELLGARQRQVRLTVQEAGAAGSVAARRPEAASALGQVGLGTRRGQRQEHLGRGKGYGQHLASRVQRALQDDLPPLDEGYARPMACDLLGHDPEVLPRPGIPASHAPSSRA